MIQCSLDSVLQASEDKGYFPNSSCTGFGQEGVNFHRNPGRGTAGLADLTWPNRAGYSIPCAIMLGFSGGGAGRRELTYSSGARSGSGSGPGERLCGSCG